MGKFRISRSLKRASAMRQAYDNLGSGAWRGSLRGLSVSPLPRWATAPRLLRRLRANGRGGRVLHLPTPLLTGSILAVGLIIALGTGIVATTPDSQPFLGTPASPQVHAVIQLGNPSLHPRQLAYDPARNGIWFWTSTQERGTTFDNRVYFYDIGRAQLRS